MKFSSLTKRIAAAEVDAWQVHNDALARQQNGEDIIVLSIGEEHEECTPPNIVQAAVDSLRSGRHHYAAISGNLDLRRAIAKRHVERTGQAVDETNCAIFAGAQNALFAVAQCVLEAGDQVILSEPYYTTYPATFSASGAELICVPATVENDFQLAPNAIIERITSRTRAIVLNSPNNPLGMVYTRAQYAAIMKECVQRHIWLINDDVYQELLLDSERANPLNLPQAEQVSISVSSLSKSHRMTGWRLGWVIAPPQMIAHLYDLSLCMAYGLPEFIQDAAVVALASGNATARQIRAQLDRRRRILLQQLDGVRGLKLCSAEGGMFVVLDISEMPVAAREFASSLLAQHNVAILPCDGFGACGANLLRVSLCVAEARLMQAGERIKAHAHSFYSPSASAA